MKKKPSKQQSQPAVSHDAVQASFEEVLGLINAAKHRATQAVNSELMTLYWQIGQFISLKLATAECGEGVVANLAEHIAQTHPGLRGFTRPNLFRMRQFFEAYPDNAIVSALLRQLPWTHHLLILSHAKQAEEREFYIRLSIREGWSKRELERQIRSGVFDRSFLTPPKVSPVVRQLYPQASQEFNYFEYEPSRFLSPAMVAQYETQLPDKKLLAAKLHEFYQLIDSETDIPSTP